MEKENNNQGFTLVETMVVVVVFTAVMSLSLGIFLVNINNQRIALYRQRLVNESSYALNKMAEEVRNGEVVSDVDDFLSDALKGNNSSAYIKEIGGRKTIFLETKIKIDEEGREMVLTLQTTATER